MLNIKSLTAGAAAAALVSAIGLAYAQTPATTDTTPAPMQPAPTVVPSSTPMPSSVPASSTGMTEPAPKADRN